MKSDIRLSTRFATTQNNHQLGLLVTLTGETPVTRPPINVALVLDRSGSMEGTPLDAAKAAARRFASFLTTGDRLSVVAFDDRVDTLFGPAAAGDDHAMAAIGLLHARGTTNLSAGWLKGRQHVEAGLVDGTNRVVLLTDGLANQGITSVDELVAMSAAARRQRVSTTCIGFGADYNEDLLEPMARDGGGNYWFVESTDQMTAIFEHEIEGLVALSAQNVEIEVALTHPAAGGVSWMQSLPVETTPDGSWRVSLGDLYATSPRALGIRFHVENVAALGRVEVARVIVTADVVTSGGIAHRKTILPVMANLDGTDHVEPMVEETFLRFETARAREEAIRLADQGDLFGAAERLNRAVLDCRMPDAGSELRYEADDLARAATCLEEGHYDAMDRKYLAAVAMSVRNGKEAYRRRIQRKG